MQRRLAYKKFSGNNLSYKLVKPHHKPLVKTLMLKTLKKKSVIWK